MNNSEIEKFNNNKVKLAKNTKIVLIFLAGMAFMFTLVVVLN
jgi:hypothetical protein